jgi:DNA-binding GntR family transcriptional regulator
LQIDAIRDSDPATELQTHHQILDAVKAGDTDLARSRLLQHFGYVKARIAQYHQAAVGNNQEIP